MIAVIKEPVAETTEIGTLKVGYKITSTIKDIIHIKVNRDSTYYVVEDATYHGGVKIHRLELTPEQDVDIYTEEKYNEIVGRNLI